MSVPAVRALAATLALGAMFAPVVATAGYEVSSYKKPSRSSDASPWDGASALDGRPDTAWLVDPEQPNQGQWIQVDVPSGTVDAISLVVGWAETDETWIDHARIKEARVEVISMAEGTAKVVLEKKLTFEDVQKRQVFDLADPKVGDELEGGRIKLTVLEVYPGKDYELLAVGEVLVHMKEFDASVRNVTEASSEVDGHGKDLAVDDGKSTYWAATRRDETPSIAVNAGRFSVSSLGLLPGPKPYGRPKRIEIEQGNAKLQYDVEDKATLQWFQVPTLFGYTGSNFGDITVRVLETWPGDEGGVAITDIRFRATTLEAF